MTASMASAAANARMRVHNLPEAKSSGANASGTSIASAPARVGVDRIRDALGQAADCPRHEPRCGGSPPRSGASIASASPVATRPAASSVQTGGCVGPIDDSVVERDPHQQPEHLGPCDFGQRGGPERDRDHEEEQRDGPVAGGADAWAGGRQASDSSQKPAAAATTTGSSCSKATDAATSSATPGAPQRQFGEEERMPGRQLIGKNALAVHVEHPTGRPRQGAEQAFP